MVSNVCISADEIHLTKCVEWADDHFDAGLMKIDSLFTKMCAATLIFDIINLKITLLFTSAKSKLPIEYELSRRFSILSERNICEVCDSQINITEMTNFRWRNVFDDICRISQRSFSSWIDVSRSIFHEDMRKNDFRSQ